MKTPARTRLSALVVAVVCSTTASAPLVRAQQAAPPGPAPELAQQVEVRRTALGVPHIKAQNLRAAFYALAYVQMEDYGGSVAIGMVRARGEMGRWFGRDSMEGDFLARPRHAIAVDRYALLDQETRDAYEGFAAGVNRYVELHPEEFPPSFAPHVTGYDVAARDVSLTSATAARRFLARVDPRAPRRPGPPTGGDAEGDPAEDHSDDGSNAWAFAPSRTKSGKAILLRNPHLNWRAGYYEGHMTVPGVIDYYGDFRVGGPFSAIGGFNRDLGWSTTDNAPDLDAIYALDVDPDGVDRYLFDGASVPLQRELVTVEYRNGEGLSSETRETWRTPLGPVIYRGGGKIYVLRAAGDRDWRSGEQLMRMMRARSLAEWKDAMRMRADVNSSYTYADRAGNIFYVWNAAVPALPHPAAGDSAAVPAHSMRDVWTHYVNFDSLPQVLNPPGGYIHNENDSPYYTNMHAVLDRARYPANFPAPSLRLRSQLAIDLVDTKKKLSLEDVVALKYSYRMLLADRVKDDLVAAVRASNPAPEVARAIDAIARWDNTTAPASKGGVLFEIWWRAYTQGTSPDSAYAQPWTPAAPTTTPRGLRDPARAAQAFATAVAETTRRFGSADVAWGDVHRARLGAVDVPIGGCTGAIGCFRVIQYAPDSAGKLVANGGDGWILAVEFADVPRALSVLAYGNSQRPESGYVGNQLEMFARGELKKVAFTEQDVEAQTAKRYHPGERR